MIQNTKHYKHNSCFKKLQQFTPKREYQFVEALNETFSRKMPEITAPTHPKCLQAVQHVTCLSTSTDHPCRISDASRLPQPRNDYAVIILFCSITDTEWRLKELGHALN
ncbi:hypothetical protein CEXT_688771 [Caerostris extrusa]|uniref:Uncharacterized protein n=1 Tax=Caerostris extrusa TaxID=172846 RepID=A0AAV4PUP5_CAEEX|nr:hypothetical protein CEXT_688771 [Caerostris extrusa]